MIKMIVTDLDETLLRTDKSISKYTIDIIKRVQNKGIKIIFATARGDSLISLIPIELFDGYVLTNGAKAYVDNKLIYDSRIASDIFIPFIRDLSNANLKVAAQIEGIHYSNFNVTEKWSYINNFIITDYLNISGSADKLYAIIEEINQIDIIKSRLPRELYLNVSRDNLAMIMHKEARKSIGILEIAKMFNISKNEILVFGDDTNDKDMFLNSGLSVAMGNAIDEIKIIADHICDTNDNDGVAKWLDENIL